MILDNITVFITSIQKRTFLRLPFFLFLILPCISQAVTLNVPADYATIQAAVDAANDGDTVLVAPGNYSEILININKDIILESSAGAASTKHVYPSRWGKRCAD